MADIVKKMDPELKAKWLTALRSGDYKQGKYQLHDANDCYCCLGVLCKIAGLQQFPMEDGGSRFGGGLFGVSTAFLPFGFEPIDHHEEAILSMKNDHGATFPEIATYIEENL